MLFYVVALVIAGGDPMFIVGDSPEETNYPTRSLAEAAAADIFAKHVSGLPFPEDWEYVVLERDTPLEHITLTFTDEFKAELAAESYPPQFVAM